METEKKRIIRVTSVNRDGVEDKKMAKTVVDTMMLITILGYVLYDLRNALEEKGYLKREIKRDFNRLDQVLNFAIDQNLQLMQCMCDQMVDGIPSEFYKCCDSLFERTDNCVELDSLDKSANMLMTILKMVKDRYMQMNKGYMIYAVFKNNLVNTFDRAKRLMEQIQYNEIDLEFVLSNKLCALYQEGSIVIDGKTES